MLKAIEEEKAEKKHKEQGKIEELEQKNKEFLEQMQRIQAEFENYRKRHEKYREIEVSGANFGLLKELLCVIDSIDCAIEKLQGDEKAIEGIELIKKQFLQVLERNGLKEIKALGERFNPEIHECVLQEFKKGENEGIVLEELQKGYLLGEKLLRPAKVKINKGE